MDALIVLVLILALNIMQWQDRPASRRRMI